MAKQYSISIDVLGKDSFDTWIIDESMGCSPEWYYLKPASIGVGEYPFIRVDSYEQRITWVSPGVRTDLIGQHFYPSDTQLNGHLSLLRTLIQQNDLHIMFYADMISHCSANNV